MRQLVIYFFDAQTEQKLNKTRLYVQGLIEAKSLKRVLFDFLRFFRITELYYTKGSTLGFFWHSTAPAGLFCLSNGSSHCFFMGISIHKKFSFGPKVTSSHIFWNSHIFGSFQKLTRKHDESILKILNGRQLFMPC